MNKLILCVSFLMVLAAMSPAPIRDRRNLTIEPEKSQSERASEQNLMFRGEVGSVPQRTENLNAPAIEPDKISTAIVADANGNVDNSKAVRASEIVKKASQDMESKKGEGPFRLLWAVLAIGVGIGIFQAFRNWANKNLPDAPASKPKRSE